MYALAHRLWDAKEGGLRYRTYAELTRLARASSAQLQQHQAARLNQLLRACAATPHYQAIMRARGITLNPAQPFADLAQFPVLSKADIQTAAGALLNPLIAPAARRYSKTGGSTGTSLNLVFDSDCQKLRNGAQMFADAMAKWQPGDKIAALWGTPPQPQGCKAKLRRALLERVFFLDTLSLSDAHMHAFAAQIRRERPRLLYGHAHSLFIFASFLAANNINDLRPEGIVSTSMMLLEPERALIEQVFNCRVTNRYGAEEVGLIGVECEAHAGMHLNSPHLIVECVDDLDQPVPPGTPGKLVITDLNNLAMPLLRYRIEDVGVMSPTPCRCGRSFPLLEKLVGRVADFLKATDGRLVAGISLIEHSLTLLGAIRQLQLVQDARDHLQIYIVSDAEGEARRQLESALLASLQPILGAQMRFTLHNVARIAQEANGKFRFAKCLV